jgi:uncharacterized membrane protein
MRGIVMIIMALDHVRDLVHVDSITQSPTNLETTTPVLFLTRWITHLCAPIFVFLAGTSAYMSFRNSNDIVEAKRSLRKRGLYLILLELTVVNFLLFFDFGFHTFIFEVIAAIGFGFIVLSLIGGVSTTTIGIIGLVIIFTHNLVPVIPFEEGSIIKGILSPLFGPGAFPFSGKVFIMAYPPIPWLGIILTGFASGKLFELPDGERKKLFLKIGGIAVVLFLVIRFINIYGDALPWVLQQNAVYTCLSFMNVTKYPPSLLFCLITLGIMFLILAVTTHAEGWLARVVMVYGKVPLFYFLAHFLVIHVLLLAILLFQGFDWSQMDFASGTFGRPKDVASGLSLGAVYVIWIAVVVFLYMPCVWFGRFKATHKHWWLKYI